METGDTKWNGLVCRLYDCIFQPQQLTEVIREFEVLIDSDGCHLFAINRNGDEILTVLTPEWLDQKHAHAYYEHYIHEDPRREYVDQVQVGQTFQCSDRFDDRFVDRSSFYQDFLIPTGARYVAGGPIVRDGAVSAYVAFNRLLGRNIFNPRQLELINVFSLHLGRVVSAIASNYFNGIRSSAQSGIFDILNTGFIALDDKYSIAYVNDIARKELGGALARDFCGQHLQSHSDLGKLATRAITSGMPQHRRLLATQSGSSDCIASIFAVSQSGAGGWIENIPCVEHKSIKCVIVLKLTARVERINADGLAQIYKLSPAESRLAYSLANGNTLEECSEQFNVSITTARTQLRSILQKTGATRQQELVRQLARLMSI